MGICTWLCLSLGTGTEIFLCDSYIFALRSVSCDTILVLVKGKVAKSLNKLFSFCHCKEKVLFHCYCLIIVSVSDGNSLTR